MDERQLREQIADDIRRKMMPICVCSACGTERDGALVNRAIDIILKRIY